MIKLAGTCWDQRVGMRAYGQPKVRRSAYVGSTARYPGYVPPPAPYSMVNRSRFGRRRATNRSLYAAGLMGIEKKFVDASISAFAIPAPGDATGGVATVTGGITGCLTAPAQGDGPSNRDGNKIVICEINALCNISVAPQAAQTGIDTSCIVFLALVQDKQTNLAAFTSEQVFTNPLAGALTAADPFRNMSFTSRFKVLAMKRFALRIPSAAGISASLEQAGFHTACHLKWKGKMPVTFTVAGTAANVNTVNDNSCQLVAFCSNASLVPLLNSNVRVRFFG